MTRYEMLDRIGVGGMAEIFRGRAIAGGGFEKPVAIKRILPHLSQDERFVQMLITEANTHSHLRHRNIVQIFDVGLGDDGQYFLVMEYVPGTDLFRLFDTLERRGKRLPVQLSVHIVAELCDALHYAHGATDGQDVPLQLVHRDVSPGNVLLSQSGEVKLTDFGIAKRMNEATGHHGVRGKFAYISPEQAVCAPVAARSDIFFLGIILYELTTGRRLFSGMNDVDALEAARSGRVPPPRERAPAMPAAVENILLRATANDPAQRYQTAAEFGSALRDYRYSSLTSMGDPAPELARIIAVALRDREEELAEFTDERTMLRILTATGFAGIGMDRRLVSDSGFDEEATRAMSGEQIQKIIEDAASGPVAPRAAVSGPPRFNVEQSQDVSIDQLLEVAPLAEAETKMLDTRGRLPSAEATPTVLLDGHAAVPQRAATPTVREMFHSGAMVDHSLTGGQQDIESEYLARYEEEYFGIPKRKAVVLATVLAVLLAVAAFVIAGGMLSSDGESAGESAGDAIEVDGGGGPNVDLPPDEIETGPGLMEDAFEPENIEEPPASKPKSEPKPKKNKKKPATRTKAAAKKTSRKKAAAKKSSKEKSSRKTTKKTKTKKKKSSKKTKTKKKKSSKKTTTKK